MDDSALSVLAFAAGARLALHHGDLKKVTARLTQAMRARPSSNSAMPYLGVRSRVQLAKVHWAIADHTAAHHLLREIDDILQRRPALGALVDTVSDFRRIATYRPQSGATEVSPLTPAELRLLPYLQTHFTTREIAERLFVSRSTVNTQIRLDLSEVGSLHTDRRRSTSDDHRSPRRIAASPTRRALEDLVSVVPQRQCQSGGRRHDARKPDDGNDTDQDVDDLPDRGAGAHRGVGLGAVGGHGTADRDQRGETHERQRLRIELPPATSARCSARPSSLMARRRNRSPESIRFTVDIPRSGPPHFFAVGGHRPDHEHIDQPHDQRPEPMGRGEGDVDDRADGSEEHGDPPRRDAVAEHSGVRVQQDASDIDVDRPHRQTSR